jgi:sec-independent protein translocase protein TatB
MNLGMSEMIFIFVLALLIFGPRKLPEIAREVGKFMAEFKRAGNDFRNQIESEIQNLELEEQIKKDAEKREEAMREAETRRMLAQQAQDQGELFDAPDPEPKQETMPTILPPENTIVNQVHTPTSSLMEVESATPQPNPEHQTESNG